MNMDEELQYPSHEAMEDWLARNRPAYQPDVLQLPLLPIPELRERTPEPAPAKEPIVIDMA